MRGILVVRPAPVSSWVAAVFAVAIGMVAVVALANHGADAHRLSVACGYLAVLGGIALYDIKTLKAPNIVVYPALAAAIIVSFTLGRSDASDALYGGLASFGVLLLIAILGRGAMGYGDVKVGTLAGLAIGLKALPMMLLATFALGGIFAATMLVLRLRDRKDPVAFTPLLALAVAVCLALGQGYLAR